MADKKILLRSATREKTLRGTRDARPQIEIGVDSESVGYTDRL